MIWACIGFLVAGIVMSLAVVHIEYYPRILHHEDNERQAWKSYYDVKAELDKARLTRAEAQEQITTLSRQIIEAERERKIICKRLEGQFRKNSELRKTMRRKHKPVMKRGGRGKNRCMKVYKSEPGCKN